MTDRWPITRYAITGGTGFLGRAIIRKLVADRSAERIVSVSRDEVKAGDLQDEYGMDGPVRVCLGDVREPVRMIQAFQGCEAVIHAAALKRVQQGAYSPFEMVKTNIEGTMNVIMAAAAAKVKRLVVVSSDKSCEAINLYGKTKAVAEDCAVQANSYTYPQGMAIACVRYGNVLGSRGSVLDAWARQLAAVGRVQLTNPLMTRFIITAEQAVKFVLDAVYDLQGGEIFVPVLPAALLADLAVAFLEEAGASLNEGMSIAGLRPGGEKLHERLLTAEEARHRLTYVDEGRYAVLPTHREWSSTAYPYAPAFLEAPLESGTAPRLSVDELRKLLQGLA